MIAGAHAAAAGMAGLRVDAVASRTPERAATLASRIKARAVAYEDLPGGCASTVVATPPVCHRADVEQSLAGGAAVLVEKPLCTTLADADALVAAAAAHGERVIYGENLAYAPVVVAMRRVVGSLGPLTNVEVRALNPRPTWGSFTEPAWGGGVLFDLGVHPLAVALMLAAPAIPVGVVAHLEQAEDLDTDDAASVEITFDTGLVARVETSWRAVTPLWDAQAASPTGVVRAEIIPAPVLEHDGERVAVARASGNVAALEDLGYVEQLRDLARLTATGAVAGPRSSVAFGRLVLDVVCAAYTSAGRGGTPEPLPFSGPRDLTPWQLWRSGSGPSPRVP
jgi:predicted dehydrogenase